MFATSFFALAAVASFAVAAPIEQRGAPANWAYGYLEDYQTYHVRYLALKCYDRKNSDYFQDCCRPMLSTENLQDNRKAYCVPSAEDVAYVSSSLAGNLPSATASADKASESEYVSVQASASSAAPSNAKVAAALSSSAAPSPVAESKVNNYVAPVPTITSTTPAWTPSPTPTSTTPAYTPPAATSTKAASNGGGETMTGGYATFFYQGGNPGACGQYHGDGDMIVAIDQARWGSSSFGGGSNTCGKWVTITNTNNGRSVSAMIADVCPTCTNGNSLDLSVGAFNAIASESDGMVPISYHFN